MEPLIVQWLRDRYPVSNRLRLGIGDDAAILDLTDAPRAVVTTDMLMDGIDFELDRCGPAAVGRKSLAVNLSDLAAMAAQPVSALVSLALPRTADLEFVKSLYCAMDELADNFGITIAGGDTNCWDQPLVVSVTAIGHVTAQGALLRSGAAPGDEILVSGAFGGSILGHHFSFQPRVAEAMRLHREFDLHAGMDVSDGLSLDLARLADASGCGAEIDLSQVPISPAAHALADQDGVPALQHALSDGEDFELILAVPQESARQLLRQQPLDVKLTRIGTFIGSSGLWQRRGTGDRTPLVPRGYLHGSDE
jgi:thiamine-monophosphate kinase